ncbi:MAG: sulfotransferase [Verrucomicrobia bacterium]|nr:sulfotransferase [Verrucomicrobiota bacterium]
MKHIHIVGTGPRTGTTLLAEAMVACFEIDEHSSHEDPVFRLPTTNPEIFLTKNPGDIVYVKPFLKILPNLFVICLIRDPRDAVVSKHGKDPDRYWGSMDNWKVYSKYWRNVRSHPRLITVRYEEFVSAPDLVQEALLKQLPFLKTKGPFSLYHEMAQPSSGSLDALRGVRPIAPVSVGIYKKHLPRIVGQLQLHGDITHDLVELGFEKDVNWKEMLAGIEPDLSRSHWPEYFTAEVHRKIRKTRIKEVIKAWMRIHGMDHSKIKRFLGLGPKNRKSS